ncbi:MAG: transcription antitermination factor NusB [Bauldia sp.]
MAESAAKVQRTANRRGAARLAAVQALYQMDVGATPIDDVIAEFETWRFGHELDGATYVDADPDFFRDIVTGVVRDQRKLDPAIHDALAADWPLVRIDVTLRAILRAAAHELVSRRDVPARVVISEYIDVAKAFFAADEPRIVNGVLDTLSRKLRPGEFADASG